MMKGLRMAAAAMVTFATTGMSGCNGEPPVAPNPGPPPGHGLVLSFADEFNGNGLDLNRWRTGFRNDPGVSAPVNHRSLPTNGERQVYVDPSFLNLGLQPFALSRGVLTITAQPLSPLALEGVRAAVAALPKNRVNVPLARIRYQSGLVTTRRSFSQTYGYFEMRARLPVGKGLWPAFWLLPEDDSWPPEIDIMEALGHEPDTIYVTIHSKKAERNGHKVDVPGSIAGFHRYGALWLPDRIEFYLDGVKKVTVPTPPDAHKPMHLLVNLAVGGHWPGDPDATTRFPARMEVDYVRAWALTPRRR